MEREVLEPEIFEQRLWNKRYVGLAILTGFFIIAIGFVIITMLELELAYQFLTAWILTVIYAALLFFWLEPAMLRTVNRTEIQTVERRVEIDRPVVKPFIIEKPVEKQVIVDRPVIHSVTLDRPFYLQRLGKQERNTHHYKFIASSTEKTYHKANCRLAKIMKPAHREHADSLEIFKLKKYKKCKKCFK